MKAFGETSFWEAIFICNADSAFKNTFDYLTEHMNLKNVAGIIQKSPPFCL